MGDLPARPHPQVRGLWRRWTSLLDVGVDMPSEDAGQRAPKLRRAVLEAAADPAAVRTHPLTLRFASPELELAFKEEYERESVRHIRFAVAMGLFLVATFGVLDAVIQPAVRHELWLIRYGVLCPTAALVLVITLVPGAFRYVEWALVVMVVVVGAGILAAIKLIRPDMLGAADEEGRRATLRRFEREAQATALLRSPHTIQLYDFGVTEEGTFYYVMELLEGYDLETVVQRFGPLPCARAVHLLVQVCHSLAEAHERGLIHRDIKPANIYLCRYGRATDFVKVLDFGLVKSWRQPDPTELGATKGGVLTGTPSCMAPEQIAGDRPLDARTDIYCVRCVAYWLLTGQH